MELTQEDVDAINRILKNIFIRGSIHYEDNIYHDFIVGKGWVRKEEANPMAMGMTLDFPRIVGNNTTLIALQENWAQKLFDEQERSKERADLEIDKLKKTSADTGRRFQ